MKPHGRFIVEYPSTAAHSHCCGQTPRPSAVIGSPKSDRVEQVRRVIVGQRRRLVEHDPCAIHSSRRDTAGIRVDRHERITGSGVVQRKRQLAALRKAREIRSGAEVNAWSSTLKPRKIDILGEGCARELHPLVEDRHHGRLDVLILIRRRVRRCADGSGVCFWPKRRQMRAAALLLFRGEIRGKFHRYQTASNLPINHATQRDLVVQPKEVDRPARRSDRNDGSWRNDNSLYAWERVSGQLASVGQWQRKRLTQD